MWCWGGFQFWIAGLFQFLVIGWWWWWLLGFGVVQWWCGREIDEGLWFNGGWFLVVGMGGGDGVLVAVDRET